MDYLIGTLTKDVSLLDKFSHKYGFANPEEFESAIKIIANAYRLYCQEKLTDTELLGHFSHMSQDLQQSVVDVVTARKPEIMAFLVREHDSRDGRLLESFDWDIRFIMGNSSLASYRSQVATLVLNCIETDGQRRTIHFEVTQPQLENMIKELESCQQKLSAMKATENKNQEEAAKA